jgi:hypothetical protein
MTAYELHFARREQALVNTVQAQDVRVALAFHERPVESVPRLPGGPCCQPKSVLRSVVQASAQVRGVPHHLFRHTADVHTGSAQPARFDKGHPRPVFRRPLGRRQAATAAAYDYEIELVGHVTRRFCKKAHVTWGRTGMNPHPRRP